MNFKFQVRETILLCCLLKVLLLLQSSNNLFIGWCRIVAAIELGSLRIILIPESKKGVTLIKISLKKCSAYCVLYSGSAVMVMSSLLFPGFVWLFLLPDFVFVTSNNFQIELLCCSFVVFSLCFFPSRLPDSLLFVWLFSLPE